MNEQDKKTFVELYDFCRDDFKSFMEAIIGLKNEPFHNDIDDAISNPLHKKVAISASRGHGKSAHLSIGFPAWLVAKDHNLRILLISSTAQVSKSFLSEVIGHIDRNEEYKKFAMHIDPMHKGVVPRMKNWAKMRENWSGDSVTIERDQLNLKDPTINAVGLFGSILSKRADVIICDDIVNQENSATEAQRQKTIDWIYTTVMPVLVPGGVFVYLGNTWHQDDLVARLMKDPQFDYKKKMPAIISESKHPELWERWAQFILDESFEVAERRLHAEEFYRAHQQEMDEGVQVLWPSRYSYQTLYLIRLANPYAFARMYQCDPSDRPDQRFKDAWLEAACKKGSKLKLQLGKRDNMEVDITTEGVDLAISEESGSDDTVHLIIDRVKYSKVENVKPGDIVIREIVRGKFTPNQVKENIKEHYNNVRPDGIRVETVGYQEAIQRDLDDAGVPVHGYKTGGEKKDPYIGINSLAIYAELGKLVLPFDNTDPRTIMLVSQLINEMRAFPDGHTGDSLMALWFAFSEMRDLTGDRVVVPSIQGNPINVDPPNLKDPEVRKPLEKKADQALMLEQQAEQQQFARMMGGMWRPPLG
ncbi:MAG: hypothetical protein KGL39_53170 [Patescibacteria group bacterium]|nr:hypothetical protein [Patescibacteria group bacterium]